MLLGRGGHALSITYTEWWLSFQTSLHSRDSDGGRKFQPGKVKQDCPLKESSKTKHIENRLLWRLY